MAGPRRLFQKFFGGDAGGVSEADTSGGGLNALLSTGLVFGGKIAV